MAAISLCSIDGCGKPTKRRTWCGPHYRKFCKHGDPLVGVTRPLAYGARRKWLDDHQRWSGEGCLFWPFSRKPNGYGLVTLPGEQQIGAHVYMCTLANGEKPTPGHEAAHSCGKGKLGCIHPQHLRWATQEENEADKVLHGTIMRGVKNGQAKLTAEQVAEIKRLRGIESGRALAERFGVTAAQISNIQLGKQWAYPAL